MTQRKLSHKHRPQHLSACNHDSCLWFAASRPKPANLFTLMIVRRPSDFSDAPARLNAQLTHSPLDSASCSCIALLGY